MEKDISTFVINLIKNVNFTFDEKISKDSLNRMNSMGEKLEIFIKDIFSDTINLSNEYKLKEYEKNFSYLGNQNNPPDIIIKESDAIEVKKIEGIKKNDIALNSSYPKNKFYKNNQMLTEACRNCEDWEEKDILYIIGYVDENKIKSLLLLYGDCFSANKEVYEKIKKIIGEGIEEMDLEISQTKELGRINKVDPLGITNLRIRGMWSLKSPLMFLNEYINFDLENKNFTFHFILREEKFNTLINKEKLLNIKDLKIRDINIKNPDNPSNLIKTKYLYYEK